MSNKTPLEDEMDFWSRQIFDHLQFLRDLTTDPEIKEVIEDRIDRWCDVRTQRNVKFNPQDQIWRVTELNNFFLAIRGYIFKGKNVGFIFPSLLNHMIEEQEYYIRLLEGNNDIISEGTFWKNELIEHTSLIAHLLDPLDDEISLQILTNLQNLKNEKLSLTELIQAMEDYIKFTKRLSRDEKISIKVNPPYFSLLSRAMYEHEIREMEHGVRRLSLLKQ